MTPISSQDDKIPGDRTKESKERLLKLIDDGRIQCPWEEEEEVVKGTKWEAKKEGRLIICVELPSNVSVSISCWRLSVRGKIANSIT